MESYRTGTDPYAASLSKLVLGVLTNTLNACCKAVLVLAAFVIPFYLTTFAMNVLHCAARLHRYLALACQRTKRSLSERVVSD